MKSISRLMLQIAAALVAIVAWVPAITLAQIGPTGGGGSSITSGTSLGTCTSSILYATSGSVLGCDPAAVVNGSVSTAGRSILTIKDTISGSSATSNFLNVTGTFNSTLSANTNGVVFDFDTTGTSNVAITGLKVLLQPGWDQQQVSIAGSFENQTAQAAGTSIGVYGNGSGAATRRHGGFFALYPANQLPNAAVGTAAALVADNGVVAANIFEARDNGTAVFTIGDGGAITATGNVNFAGSTSFISGTIDSIFDMGGGGSIGGLAYRTSNTPDIMLLYTGSTPNSIHIAEYVDRTFDFQNPCTTGLGTAACTDPTFIVHSHNQDTGEFLSMAHDGKAGVIVGGNSTVLDGTIRLGGTVTLTESSATTVLTIPIPVSTGSGGFINYVVDARDATNVQVRTGNVSFAVANTSGGTETCNVFGIGPTTQAAGGDTTNPANPTQVQDGSGVGAITSGTLTYAWSVDTTGSNSCVLKLNAVSSLTQTTLQVHYTVISTGPAIVTGG